MPWRYQRTRNPVRSQGPDRGRVIAGRALSRGDDEEAPVARTAYRTALSVYPVAPGLRGRRARRRHVPDTVKR